MLKTTIAKKYNDAMMFKQYLLIGFSMLKLVDSQTNHDLFTRTMWYLIAKQVMASKSSVPSLLT